MLLALTQAGSQYVFDRPVRMLVVDDDPIMREFALGQLAQPGCEIATAEDGEEAWAMIEADRAGFDLVLSDLEMPRMNGFALVDAIRQSPRHRHLPVVVITSRDDMFAIDRAYEVGATSFVAKPVNWRLLAYQLRYVMRTSRMEAEVRAAGDAARRAAELRASLLTLLQHETRTPLHGIIGFAELLQAGAQDPAALAAHAGQVLGAARELNEKLRRIFYYAQASTGTLALEREEVALADLVEQAVRALHGRAAARQVAIALRAPDEPVPVACDLRHLGAALQELLANAVAHSPAGGCVELEVAREGADALLSIRDRGPGIAADMLARCLEPFAQGADAMTRAQEGLGLGLPLARSQIERHGGALALVATAEGVEARVTLPAAAPFMLDRECGFIGRCRPTTEKTFAPAGHRWQVGGTSGRVDRLLRSRHAESTMSCRAGGRDYKSRLSDRKNCEETAAWGAIFFALPTCDRPHSGIKRRIDPVRTITRDRSHLCKLRRARRRHRLGLCLQQLRADR